MGMRIPSLREDREARENRGKFLGRMEGGGINRVENVEREWPLRSGDRGEGGEGVDRINTIERSLRILHSQHFLHG